MNEDEEMILPVGHIHADAYFSFRNLYQPSRGVTSTEPRVDQRSIVNDVVDLSQEAQAFVAASKQ